MDLKLNESIEVTEKQFKECLKDADGYVAHRQNKGKYYIKILIPGRTDKIKKILKENKELFDALEEYDRTRKIPSKRIRIDITISNKALNELKKLKGKRLGLDL